MTDLYKLGPEGSCFTVQGFATGMLSGFAHNPTFAIRDFTGELRFTPGTFENMSIQLTVRANSLELTDRISDKDRDQIHATMKQETLEVAKYPEISFRSTEIAATRITENWYRTRILGQMQLHGVTQPQVVDSQLRIGENDLKLTGEFVLSQALYRIRKATGMGGLIKMKDDLKIAFDLVGLKQEQAAT